MVLSADSVHKVFSSTFEPIPNRRGEHPFRIARMSAIDAGIHAIRAGRHLCDEALRYLWTGTSRRSQLAQESHISLPTTRFYGTRILGHRNQVSNPTQPRRCYPRHWSPSGPRLPWTCAIEMGHRGVTDTHSYRHIQLLVPHHPRNAHGTHRGWFGCSSPTQRTIRLFSPVAIAD